MGITLKDSKPCHSSNYSGRNGAKIEYIVIHYTAGNGDTAVGNCSYFSGANRSASAHYFVGDDGICRSVPDNMRAWHCGGTIKYKHAKCRNANSIGIEMGSRKDAKGEYYITDNIVEQTIRLVKYLMDKYNIPITNVLRHYDVWDKQCPAPFVKHPEQWENFKKRLTKQEDEPMTAEEKAKFNALVNAVSDLTKEVEGLKKPEMIYNYIDSNMPSSYKPTIQKLVKAGKLQGNENGELMLTTDMMRILTILDRVGVLG